MAPQHLDAVASIEGASSQHPWSRRLFADELNQANSWCIVALNDEEQVVGFGCLMSTGFETHITNLATRGDFRRRGVARALVHELLEITRSLGLDAVTLEVRMSNHPAQRCYQSFGFHIAGVRPDYYSSPTEDALIMWRTHGGADATGG